jgi:biopolymer transport protein ExbB
MAMNMTLDIVNLVLLFLAMLSVLVWGVVIYKGWAFYKINQQNKYFADALKEVKHLRGVVTIARDAQGSLARGSNNVLSRHPYSVQGVRQIN